MQANGDVYYVLLLNGILYGVVLYRGIRWPVNTNIFKCMVPWLCFRIFCVGTNYAFPHRPCNMQKGFLHKCSVGENRWNTSIMSTPHNE